MKIRNGSTLFVAVIAGVFAIVGLTGESAMAMPTPFVKSMQELQAVMQNPDLAARFDAMATIDTIEQLKDSQDPVGGRYFVRVGTCGAFVQTRWVSDGHTVPGKVVSELQGVACAE